MNEKELVRLSKRLSSWLRHQPDAIGLTPDAAGWVRVEDLLRQAAAHHRGFTRAQLETVVAQNNKRRFEFDESGTSIRARQGHSIEVDLGYTPADPPALLFHGTAERALGLIRDEGLLPMRRHAVHLSADIDTAVNVGARHGRPAVLRVDTAAMVRDGHDFFVTGNGVWLVDTVPPQYLELITAPREPVNPAQRAIDPVPDPPASPGNTLETTPLSGILRGVHDPGMPASDRTGGPRGEGEVPAHQAACQCRHDRSYRSR
ncbi:RNA 2'-phosphotransferase [Nocardia acidivorans]|uniref:RNA 2'-phosphotransferase n=1 Tax=Nocardia acidivorans TaxID=404580 RepID=UPI0008363115|nr:RNA 2'-phosphotransferase [Nocardia acidivorans]